MDFPVYTECEDCNLHAYARNRGIPTRPLHISGKDIAILIVGESPGYNEDAKGESWIGYAGKLLQSFISAAGFAELCDVYLGNACRCRRPQKITMTQGFSNKCRPHLQADIDILRQHYKEVVLFACGGPATYSISKTKTLALAFRNQGMDTELFGEPLTCFFTYHPAILHPSRKPALVSAVEAHFNLVRRYLTGDMTPQKVKIEPLRAEAPPAELPYRLSLDIETYGILEGKEQTVFHPIKSKHIDNIPLGEQIETVSIGYLDEQGNPVTYIFQPKIAREYTLLKRWLTKIIEEEAVIVGQNVKFDILYLRYNYGELAYLLTPDKVTLDDTLLLGFLLYDQSPERGLKETALLRGYTGYNEDAVTGKSGNAKSYSDPDLHYYNCKDSGYTILIDKDCQEDIARKYGKDTPKLSIACAALRNDIIWDTIELEKNGCCLNTDKLSILEKECTAECEETAKELLAEDIIVAGEGSDKSLREFVQKAADACGLLGDKRFKFTKKDHRVSSGKENLALLKQYLTDEGLTKSLDNVLRFRQSRDIMSRYTRPLQNEPRKGIVLCANGSGGIVYPSWYPMPGYHSRGGSQDAQQGGTIQARFSAQKPSVPTFPPRVKKCMTCRRPGFKLIEYDLGQIELRMASLLSGDPFMMDDYLNGRDRHAATTKDVLYPGSAETDEDWNDKRQLGKKLNFLVLYRGGAKRFREVAMAEEGLQLTYDFCKSAIDRFYRKHSVLWRWQEGLIEEAAKKGYLELPTGWSRTFGLGSQGVSAYMNEICNCPVQTLSAQLLQSGMFRILQSLYRRLAATIIVSYAYDSLYMEVANEEEEWVDEEVSKWLTRPPILSTIEDAVGRSIPITYNKEIIYSDGDQ